MSTLSPVSQVAHDAATTAEQYARWQANKRVMDEAMRVADCAAACDEAALALHDDDTGTWEERRQRFAETVLGAVWDAVEALGSPGVER